MKISKIESESLRIATFLATILVVLRHSFNLHLYYKDGNPWMQTTDANIFLQRFCSSFTDVAIPAFFLMSGFFFFQGMNHWQECIPKWQKRIKSLLLPYILWNFLFLILWSCLSLMPCLKSQIQHSFQLEWSFLNIFSRMTYAPIVGQFWYIRTLILFLLFAPLLLLVLKSAPLSLITFIALVRRWLPIDTGVFSTEGMLFFFIGSWLGVNGSLPKEVSPKYWAWLLVPLFIRLVTPLLGKQWIPLSIGTTLELYIGWQFCLWLAQRTRFRDGIMRLNQNSFFIYALHGSIVSGSALLISQRIPHTSFNSAITYWGCFIFTVVFSLGISRLFRQICPKGYLLLSGGR